MNIFEGGFLLSALMALFYASLFVSVRTGMPHAAAFLLLASASVVLISALAGWRAKRKGRPP
jgi:membrane protein implicated in regulation of membrane protease activity